MPAPIIVSVPQGISISEQKCYLKHEGDSQAIIDCLNAVASTNVNIALVIVALIIALLVWAYFCA